MAGLSAARPPTLRTVEGAASQEAGAVWRDLEQRLGSKLLTCSWDWTDSWLRAFGDVVSHRFVFALDGDEVLGAALVTRGRGRRLGGLPLRTLHVGTAGEPPGEGIFVEYNRLLCAPEARPAFASSLLSFIEADRGWDRLMLEGFAPEDVRPFLDAEPGLTVREEVCPTADLRPAREEGGDALSLLRSGSRQRVRRSLRGLGDVSSEWAEGPEQAREVLDELITLHQRRWKESEGGGAFAAARTRRFHHELLSRLAPQGRAVLFRVRAGTTTVGCLYGFVEGRRLLFYQSGFGEFEDAKVKPGLTAHALLMQACLERGFDEYDLLAGDSRYKRELANSERTLVWAETQRRTPRLMPGLALHATRRAARRLSRSGG